MAHQDSANPCSEFGPAQRAAVVWFFGVLVGGTMLGVWLSRIDNRLYQTKNHYLDYDAYTENRFSQYTVGSERVDERARGDLSAARARAAYGLQSQ